MDLGAWPRYVILPSKVRGVAAILDSVRFLAWALGGALRLLTGRRR
jgi:hypothetical protein